METHEYANLLPMMQAAEYSALLEDMRAGGYDETLPVVLLDGKILDGRNRYKAAKELGIRPAFTDYTGDDPLGFVIRHNLNRRHLNESQRAVIASRVASMGKGGDKKSDTYKNQSANLPIDSIVSQPAAAAMLNVSERSVRTVKAVERQAPELIAAIESGTISGHDASKIAKAEPVVRREAVAMVQRGEFRTAEQAVKAIKIIEREERKEQKQAVAQAAMVEAGESEIEVTTGDYWRLGAHILYCGDTSTPQWLRGERAAFAFADPPYGAGVETFKDDSFYWEHDYLADCAAVIAVTPGIVSIFEFARKTAMDYKWSISTWITNGMTRGAIGFGNWIYTAVFSRGSVYKNSQDHYKISIMQNETERTAHKGRKPSAYMVDILTLFTKKGDVVIDPFAGSGSTLLVCEAMGLRCITGEIVPEFCKDIILQWEEMTGEKAVKE